MTVKTLFIGMDGATFTVLNDLTSAAHGNDRTSLFEYVLRRLVHDGLADRGAIRPAMVSLSSLKTDSAALLALLARAGHGDADDTRAAFTAATLVAPIDPPWESRIPASSAPRPWTGFSAISQSASPRFARKWLKPVQPWYSTTAK